MSEFYHITGRQIAAARTLLGMGQVELAESASISAPTLRRVEAAKENPIEGTASKNNLAALIRALEAAGVEFIETERGEGVIRLRRNEP